MFEFRFLKFWGHLEYFLCLKLCLLKLGNFGLDPTPSLTAKFTREVVYKYIDNTMAGQCSLSEIGASLNKVPNCQSHITTR